LLLSPATPGLFFLLENSMSDALSAVMADLKLEPTSVVAPGLETGDWKFAFAKFGTLGFLRCLVCEEPAKVFVHFVLPHWTLPDAVRAAEIYATHTKLSWEAREHDGGFALVAGLSETPNWGQALSLGGRLSDFVDSDHDAHTTLAALFPSHLDDTVKLGIDRSPAGEESPSIEESPATEKSPVAVKSPFEEIGAVEAATPVNISGAPKFDLTASREGAQLTFNLGRSTKSGELARFATALRRHLRSYADVDVDILESEDSVSLAIRGADWAEFPSQQAFMEAVQRALTPIEDMIKHGVTPSVALGLAGLDGVEIAARPAPRAEAEEVVFSAVEEGPLKSGNFDDARLSEPRSTSNLVDVVLRHPGYSDRRVGQVLSILLSIEYFAALRLMQASPIVIARAVANSRALTMQEVIEGAGGKIQLTDPDRYPIS
jgi:hypothetical protein